MKYVGSKARIAKYICPIINDAIKTNNIETYVEPFVGGGNVIQHIQCKNKIGYDSNKYLIAMWQALQNGWDPSTVSMSRELYNAVKDHKENYPPEIVALAGFCATYNAKWFGGYAGIVHTKIGTTRNYYAEAVRNIMAQINSLQDVQFCHGDFYNIAISAGSLIYCDPPYRGTTGYHNTFDNDRYWNHIRELSKSNLVICSEYTAPIDFTCIWQGKTTVTLDKNSRLAATEKLFIYNPKEELNETSNQT